MHPTINPHSSPVSASLLGNLSVAIDRAHRALFKRQNLDDGYWCADLLVDTTLNADYIMLLNYLDLAEPTKIQKLAQHLIDEQRPEGGWSIYKNGPAELSATVKAYWALKFAGHRTDEPLMVRARHLIDRLGGIHHINTFSKIYLALFGQYDWRGIPTITPEIMLFPKWFYFNLYEMSAWTRTIVVPLSIIWAKRPTKQAPAHARLDELFPDARRHISVGEAMPRRRGEAFWQNFFLAWDSALKWLEGRGPYFLRVLSLKKAEAWMRERLENSEGLGTIFPAMLNAVVAMRALGYDKDEPLFQKELAELEKFEIEREGCIQMQPCYSPVWDTALSIRALTASGVRRDHPALQQALRWLLDKEVRIPGDVNVKDSQAPVGGWFFQFGNPWYPDVDDTAMVMMAIQDVVVEPPFSQERGRASMRGLQWIFALQSKNGECPPTDQ